MENAPFVLDVYKASLENELYRSVLYTTGQMQLILMSLRPDEGTSDETHGSTQIIRVETGEGEITIKGVNYHLRPGILVIIPAGLHHRFKTTGSSDLKLNIVSFPPEFSSIRAEYIDPKTKQIVVLKE